MTLIYPLALLLILPAAAFTVWAWHNSYLHLSRRRRIVTLVVRSLLLLSLILGLAGLALRLPQGREAVVYVVDLSASNAGEASAMQSVINSGLRVRPSDGVAGVVTVGRQAVVEQPVSSLSTLDGFQTTVDPNYTNLESGMELAGAIMPPGYRRRVVVLSDGQENIGDSVSAARLLRAQGVRVDVVPDGAVGGSDVRLDAVDIPSQLRLREDFTLGLRVTSTFDTSMHVDIYRDNRLVLSHDEAVRVGQNHYVFNQHALTPGWHRYQVHLVARGDSVVENKTGSAFVSVQGRARVLIIAAVPAEAHNVVASLRSTGSLVDLETPAQVTPTLTNLQRYAAVVIVDTPAPLVGTDLSAQLAPYVRDLGRGLVVIGGESAYGLGGYGQTPLEQVLPVKMDLPKRKDFPSAAVVLVIESLESPQPVNISKEAGKGIVKLLTEQDYVAVNDAPDDGTTGWAVPLQRPINKAEINRAIDEMQPGDPNSYLRALQRAYDALQRVHTQVKHIIVLGDGDAVDRRYQALIQRIHASHITVSSVVTNAQVPGDFQAMRDIAHWGGGRYYRADDPAKIPNIFLREAKTVARSGIVNGRFFPRRISSNPILNSVKTIPPLDGYVATAPKPSGELVLVSQKLDPVLAAWQFGLGRSVAWTSDAAGLWTHQWLSSPSTNRIWANMVDWVLPSSSGRQLYVTASNGEGQGRISVNSPPTLGLQPKVTAHVVDPRNHSVTVNLQPSAPGRYEGAFPTGPQGSYIITVEARGSGHASVGQAGLDVPYSPEYRVTGSNPALLRAVAQAGGGAPLVQAGNVWDANLPAVYDQRSLQELLWIVALLLFPIDIAARRLVLTRRDVDALRAAMGLPVRPGIGQEVGDQDESDGWTTDTGARRPTRSGRKSGLTPPKLKPLPVRSSRDSAVTGSPAPAAVGRMATSSLGDDDSTVGRLLAAKRRRQ